MSSVSRILASAMGLAAAAAVALYALAPAWRAWWLLLMVLCASAAGLLVARSGRPQRRGGS